MPIFNKVDKERRLVLSTASGVFTLADALAYQQQLLTEPDFDPSFSQLADFTHVSKFELGPEDIQALAERSIFSPESRRAFVVKGDLAFGLGRMFEILRENMGERGIRVFRTLEEALDWILSKKDAT